MSEGISNRDIVLYQDRAKLLRSVAFPIAIGAGLAAMFLRSRRSGTILARLVAFLSALSLAGWGYLTLPSLWRLLIPKPIVIVNQSGITYDPPRAAFFDFGASLPWDEIEALYPFELTLNRPGGTSKYNFLCVVPRDMEAFMHRRSLLNMTVMVILMNQSNAPFMIPEPMLPISAHALMVHIHMLYADEMRAHGIEIRAEQKNTLMFSQAKDLPLP